MRKDDVKKVSNLEWVIVRKEQGLNEENESKAKAMTMVKQRTRRRVIIRANQT